MKKEVIFQGYYGFKNAGDDSFVEVSSWGSKRFWGFEKATYIGKELPEVRGEIRKVNSSNNLLLNHLNNIQIITNSHALISAGGSIFHSIPHLLNLKNLARFKKKLNSNFILGAIGVSIGPFKSPKEEKVIINQLSCYDFISVRDKASFNLLSEYQLPFKPILSFDLAALQPTIYDYDYSNKDASNIVGLSICPFESFFVDEDSSLEYKRGNYYFEVCKEIYNNNNSVEFIIYVFNGNSKVGDAFWSIWLFNKLKDFGIGKVYLENYDFNVFSFWKKVVRCDVMLATRLHAGIYACFADIPFFLVEYHKKCSDFLDTIGFEDLRIDKFLSVDSQLLADRVIQILDNIKEFKKPKRIGDCIKNALKSFSAHSEFFI
ncbi:MAG: polysaccharide pyruvyl transferase family protein [Flavobacteriaceae bacterium]|nr:polysaccharide pyruvyl transferase family protein [Flavobacteriaceae bacterium]